MDTLQSRCADILGDLRALAQIVRAAARALVLAGSRVKVNHRTFLERFTPRRVFA